MTRAAILWLLLGSVVQAQPRIVGTPDAFVPPTSKVPLEDIPIPRITLRIATESTNLKLADFRLALTDDPSIAVPARRLVPFADSDEPLSLIILVDGKVRFLGDPAPEPIDGVESAPIEGAWEEVLPTIDVLAKMRSKRTRMALWVYGDTVVPKVELGDPGQIGGDALGERREYAKVGTSGLRLALASAGARLASEPGRRVIVVIGDGGDTQREVSYQNVLADLRGERIELYALLGTVPSRPPDGPSRARFERAVNGLGKVFRAQSLADLPQLAANLVALINGVYTAEFPGAILGTEVVMLPWDAQVHDLTLSVKTLETSFELRLPEWHPPPVPPPPPVIPWWLVVVGGVVLLCLVVVAVVLLRPRPVEEEEAQPEEVVVEPPPPPVVAPAPSHTVPIDLNAMPIVGWLVPLSGPSARQTFRLRSMGTSVIGTVPGCDVVVPDQYMSREHAEITVESGNFILRDRGSTNGVRVKEQRVVAHELVDNDLFTLGETVFAFKSIN